MKQIPWAYIIPSHKMSRRRFIIKIAPEMETAIHQDSLKIFKYTCIRVITSPLWLPLAFVSVSMSALATGCEKLADVSYNAFQAMSFLWCDQLPDFKGKGEVEEISRDEFWRRVEAYKASGGKVHSYFNK